MYYILLRAGLNENENKLHCKKIFLKYKEFVAWSFSLERTWSRKQFLIKMKEIKEKRTLRNCIYTICGLLL
jgi:hypothetical protein